jgi:hypothetical protein
MTATVEAAGLQALTPLSAAVDSLLAADLARLSRDELLDALRGLECESLRLAAVGHRLVGEVAARNVAGELRYRDTASLLDTGSCGRPRPGSWAFCTRTARSPRTGCTAPTATSHCAAMPTAPGMFGRS